MESRPKIFCLVVLLEVLSSGTIYTQGQTVVHVDLLEEIGQNGTNTTAGSTVTVPTTTMLITTVLNTTDNATVPTTVTVVPTTTGTATVQTTTSEAVVTTQVVTTSNSTETTPGVTTSKPCSTHSFDAASFVGGIVLGLGVCGIAFFIFKWYQSTHPSAAPYQQF